MRRVKKTYYANKGDMAAVDSLNWDVGRPMGPEISRKIAIYALQPKLFRE